MSAQRPIVDRPARAELRTTGGCCWWSRKFIRRAIAGVCAAMALAGAAGAGGCDKSSRASWGNAEGPTALAADRHGNKQASANPQGADGSGATAGQPLKDAAPEQAQTDAAPGQPVTGAPPGLGQADSNGPRAAAPSTSPLKVSNATAPIDLLAMQQSFESLVREASPSVVGIRARRRYLAGLPGESSTDSGRGSEQLVLVNGSGTVLSDDGEILTNEHVVQAATEIEAIFSDGSRRPANIVATDPRSDLAVLRVARGGLRPARLADPRELTRGQWAVAIGNPYGLGADGQLSVSIGVVSNLGRQLPGLGEADDRFYNDMIQTTAAISPGNSGGPLFNIRGELIGVITAMHARAPAEDGIGFAIPLTQAKREIIERLRKGQRIEYGYIGLTARPAEAAERESLHLDPGNGAIVQQVEPHGPAEAAGLKVGDVIVRFGDVAVRGAAHLAECVGMAKIGSDADMEIRRGTEQKRVQVHVEARQIGRVSWMRGGAITWRGAQLTDIGRDSRRRLRVAEAAAGVVVVDVGAGTAGEKAGLHIGDVIERVDGEPVSDALDFLARVRETFGPVELTLRMRGPLTVNP